MSTKLSKQQNNYPTQISTLKWINYFLDSM